MLNEGLQPANVESTEGSASVLGGPELRLEEITKMLPYVPEQFSTLSKQIGIVTSVISTQLHDTFIGVQALWSDADSKPTALGYLETST